MQYLGLLHTWEWGRRITRGQRLVKVICVHKISQHNTSSIHWIHWQWYIILDWAPTLKPVWLILYYNKLYAVKKIQRFDFESVSDSEYVNLAQPDTTKNPNRGFVLTWNIIYIHSSVTHSLLISLSLWETKQVCTL